MLQYTLRVCVCEVLALADASETEGSDPDMCQGPRPRGRHIQTHPAKWSVRECWTRERTWWKPSPVTSCILHPTSYILHPASCILPTPSQSLHLLLCLCSPPLPPHTHRPANLRALCVLTSRRTAMICRCKLCKKQSSLVSLIVPLQC